MPTAPAPGRLGASRGSVALGMLILYAVWGSTYLGISIAVETLPPFLMAAFRFGIAGAIMFGWVALRRGRPGLRMSRREVRDAGIVGALLLGGGMGAVAWASQTVPSGIIALVVATMPMWVAMLGALLLGQRQPALAIIGVIVGFAGIALLIAPTIAGGEGALDPAGLLLALLSPISWALGSLFASHRATLPKDPIMNTATQMAIGTVALVVLGAIDGEFATLPGAVYSTESIIALVYLTIIGSLLAFTTYGWLLRVAPLPLVITYAYVNPIVAVILGAIVRDEVVDARTIAAAAIIVGAVALIVTARGRMQAPRAVATTAGPTVSPPPGPSGTPAEPTPSRSASG